MNFKQYVDTNKEQFDSLEVDSKVWENIESRIDELDKPELNQNNSTPFKWIIISSMGAVLLAILGFLYIQMSEQQNILHAQNELDENLKEIKSLLTQNRTSSRIKAINKVGFIQDNRTNQVPMILLQTVKSDPSLNVKFAALNALENYVDREEVRIGLIDILMQSQDQKLKVRVLSFLSEANEGRIEPLLEELIENNSDNSLLKKEAGVALDKIKNL